MTNSNHFQNTLDNLKQIISTEELRELNSIIIDRIREMNRRESADKKLNFSLGTKVKIKEERLKGRKKGSTLEGKVGTITKLNRTKAIVDFGGFQKWQVPYEMLEGVN
jgi:hypothetical protein